MDAGDDRAPDDLIYIVKGRVMPGLVTVYSVIKNEMFFLPAFLDHYRQLGIGQFFFLDDRSDDGTFEFLSDQPDCIIARSGFRFGERIDGKRAVNIWRSEIPRRHMPGQWAICADADEFLFIPPQFPTMDAFIQELDQRGLTAVAAVMVDFYPETVQQMESLGVPSNRDDLFSSYPWFDAGPYFRWDAGHTLPIAPYGGVRERLLKKFKISKRSKTSKRRRPKSWFQRRLNKIAPNLTGKRYGPFVSKVPLVKWSPDLFYRNSHALNIAPDTGILLPLAHFKLTSNLHGKIEMATASRMHANASRDYFEYAELIAAMKAGDGSFLCPHSVHFAGPADFETASLMKFEPR